MRMQQPVRQAFAASAAMGPPYAANPDGSLSISTCTGEAAFDYWDSNDVMRARKGHARCLSRHTVSVASHCPPQSAGHLRGGE